MTLQPQASAILCACAILGATASLSSCKGNDRDTAAQDTLWTRPAAQDSIIALDPIAYRHAVTLGSSRLTYEYRMQPCDSLPVITNADGARYYDNEVELTVWRDDSVRLFHRRFLKRDFAEYAAGGNLDRVGLVGFSYNPMKADDTSALYFLATVGDPDESAGVNFPVELRVTPSGSLTMQRAEDMETEPLQDGLNQEPNI